MGATEEQAREAAQKAGYGDKLAVVKTSFRANSKVCSTQGGMLAEFSCIQVQEVITRNGGQRAPGWNQLVLSSACSANWQKRPLDQTRAESYLLYQMGTELTLGCWLPLSAAMG